MCNFVVPFWGEVEVADRDLHIGDGGLGSSVAQPGSVVEDDSDAVAALSFLGDGSGESSPFSE